MKISYYNYQRMNDFLSLEIRKELETLHSLDIDSELFRYQYKNEKKIGKRRSKGHAFDNRISPYQK